MNNIHVSNSHDAAIIAKEALAKTMNQIAPPYLDRGIIESPIELEFIDKIVNRLSSEVKIIPHYYIKTGAGVFRIGFLLTLPNNRRVAVECDNVKNENKWWDTWRDALILGTKEVDVIYRIKGKHASMFFEDSIYLLWICEKKLFNNRYEDYGSKLISENLSAYLEYHIGKLPSKSIVEHKVKNRYHEDTVMYSIFERKTLDNKWYRKKYHDFSTRNPGKSLNELMVLYELTYHRTR